LVGSDLSLFSGFVPVVVVASSLSSVGARVEAETDEEDETDVAAEAAETTAEVLEVGAGTEAEADVNTKSSSASLVSAYDTPRRRVMVALAVGDEGESARLLTSLAASLFALPSGLFVSDDNDEEAGNDKCRSSLS
jgi:hypothetical protein